MQLKMRTSKPAKLNIDMSNGEEVSLQKYEIIRYEWVHYGKPRLVNNSRPNTVSHAVGCQCLFTYKCQEESFWTFLNRHAGDLIFYSD